jgi:NADH dehydrogenase
VVIVGGGFAGLRTAQGLRRAAVEVTLIDRRNFHLFQPLLYQVATGGLSPANIATPLRSVLRRQKNARVLLGEVRGFDLEGRRVLLSDGEIGYDTLVVATGARHHYFGRDHWEPLAPGLKTVEEATEIRRRVLRAYEEGERATDPDAVRALLTFVVVGAGPTGVELAGALAELARVTLRDDFRAIDPAGARILLVEGADRVLPGFPAELSAKAGASLESLGVELRTGTLVGALDPGRVALGRSTDHEVEIVEARTVLWAAGIRASDLGAQLASHSGAELDRIGRVRVEPDLSLPGRPEVLVLGDLAHTVGPDGEPLPGLAPVAMQQGRYAARLIVRRLRGHRMRPFRYRDRGTMATIGRRAAVADLGRWRLSGYPAWLLWLFIHLLYIVEFSNRLLVLVQWAWNYWTRNRSARLITGEDPPEGHSRPESLPR